MQFGIEKEIKFYKCHPSRYFILQAKRLLGARGSRQIPGVQPYYQPRHRDNGWSSGYHEHWTKTGSWRKIEKNGRCGRTSESLCERRSRGPVYSNGIDSE
jgi:hypothetical protein